MLYLRRDFTWDLWIFECNEVQYWARPFIGTKKKHLPVWGLFNFKNSCEMRKIENCSIIYIINQNSWTWLVYKLELASLMLLSDWCMCIKLKVEIILLMSLWMGECRGYIEIDSRTHMLIHSYHNSIILIIQSFINNLNLSKLKINYNTTLWSLF